MLVPLYFFLCLFFAKTYATCSDTCTEGGIQRILITPPNNDSVPEKKTYATFDVTKLCLTCNNQLKYYQLLDDRYSSSDNYRYTYIFNVNNRISEWPSNMKNPEMCNGRYCSEFNNQTCVAYEPITNDPLGYAYQLKLNGDNTIIACWPLSDTDTPATYSLIDIENPSLGFIITYDNGEYSDDCKENRKSHLRFECSTSSNADIPKNTHWNIDFKPHVKSNDASVSESSSLCEYSVNFHNTYGCPTECPSIGSQICNNFGLCGYDFTNKVPRCFCYAYQTGSSCNIPDFKAIFHPPKKLIPVEKKYSHEFGFKRTKNNLLSSKFKIPLKNIKHFFKNANSNPSVWYSLSPFVLSSTMYNISDIDGYKYRYYFNIHEPLTNDNLPYICIQRILNYTTVYALQYDYIHNQCWILATKFNPKTDWTLINTDARNVGKGTVLQYSDGEECVSHDGQIVNRSLAIQLSCPDDNRAYYPMTTYDMSVVEVNNDKCSYVLELKSAFACPYQCITGNPLTIDDMDDYGVCNNHGMCATDIVVGYVRCLCDAGYGGDYCEQTAVEVSGTRVLYKHAHYGGYIAGIVLLSALVIAVCFCAYKKLAKQNTNIVVLRSQLQHSQQNAGESGTVYDGEYAKTMNAEKKILNVNVSGMGGKIINSVKKMGSRIKKNKYSNVNAMDVVYEDDDEQGMLNEAVIDGRFSLTDDMESQIDTDGGVDGGTQVHAFSIGNVGDENVDDDQVENEEEVSIVGNHSV